MRSPVLATPGGRQKSEKLEGRPARQSLQSTLKIHRKFIMTQCRFVWCASTIITREKAITTELMLSQLPMLIKMKVVVLILSILVGFVFSDESDELGMVLQEDEAFWGRSLLRGAASMSHSMSFPTPTPPTPAPSCEILYGLSYKPGEFTPDTLSTIDVATNTKTTLAEVSIPSITDIALDDLSETIRYTRSIGFSTSSLCQMDPISGEEIGCVGQFSGRITALQFVMGILYGTYTDEDYGTTFMQYLVMIDIVSG